MQTVELSKDHEGDIDKAVPGRNVEPARRRPGEVGDPQGVGPGGLEVTVHEVLWAGRGLVADRRARRPAANDALAAQRSHQALHGAPGHVLAFTPQFPPDLARAVHLEVLFEDPTDMAPQFGVAPHPGRRLGGIGAPRRMSMVRRRGPSRDAPCHTWSYRIAYFRSVSPTMANRLPSGTGDAGRSADACDVRL